MLGAGRIGRARADEVAQASMLRVSASSSTGATVTPNPSASSARVSRPAFAWSPAQKWCST